MEELEVGGGGAEARREHANHTHWGLEYNLETPQPGIQPGNLNHDP